MTRNNSRTLGYIHTHRRENQLKKKKKPERKHFPQKLVHNIFHICVEASRGGADWEGSVLHDDDCCRAENTARVREEERGTTWSSPAKRKGPSVTFPRSDGRDSLWTNFRVFLLLLCRPWWCQPQPWPRWPTRRPLLWRSLRRIPPRWGW